MTIREFKDYKTGDTMQSFPQLKGTYLSYTKEGIRSHTLGHFSELIHKYNFFERLRNKFISYLYYRVALKIKKESR